MGIIVDANEDHDANDTYALVSSGVVVNVIVASYNFCNDNILDSFDYLVDITVGEQTADIDYTYDPENDQFTPPVVVIDYIARLEADLDQIIDDLALALSDSNGMSPENIQAAIDESFADEGDGFTENESALNDAISAYILGGG